MSPEEVVTELKVPSNPQGVSHQMGPTQPSVTQQPPMQPPILPPPPHPNFKSTELHQQLPQTRNNLFISNSQAPVTHSSTSEENNKVLGTTLDSLSTGSQPSTSSSPQFHQQVNQSVFEVGPQPSKVDSESEKDQVTNTFTFGSSSKFPADEPSGFTPTPTQSPAAEIKTRRSVTLRFTSAAESHESKPNSLQQTKSPVSYQNTFSQVPQAKQTPSPSLPHQPFTLSFSPKFHLELSTLLPPTGPPPPSSSSYTTQLHNHTERQKMNTSQAPMTSTDSRWNKKLKHGIFLL